MGIERRSEVIPASGRIETGSGNFFLLLSSTVAVNLRVERHGTSEGFDNVTGGIRIQRLQPWNNVIVIGAAGGTVVYMVGIEKIERDDTNVFIQVATISGTVAVSDAPSSAVATPADNAIAAATTENIPANLLRRRITIGVLSTELAGVRVQAVGAVDLSGVEIQPGTFVEFRTTASLDIRNNDAANATAYYVFEES